MSRYIVKLTDPVTSTDYYLEWSTIVDSPVTYGMSLQEFKNYYKEEYGRSGLLDLDQRLALVEKNGISSMNNSHTLNWLLSQHVDKLTPEQILQKYCIDRPSEEPVSFITDTGNPAVRCTDGIYRCEGHVLGWTKEAAINAGFRPVYE